MTYTNVHEFTGRIANLPETTYFTSGKSVTKFNVAVRRPYASEEPVYHTCEAWGKLSETAANYLEVGKVVSIGGEMKISTWTDKNTEEPRSRAIFIVNKIDLITGSKKTSELVEAAIAV